MQQNKDAVDNKQQDMHDKKQEDTDVRISEISDPSKRDPIQGEEEMSERQLYGPEFSPGEWDVVCQRGKLSTMHGRFKYRDVYMVKCAFVIDASDSSCHDSLNTCHFLVTFLLFLEQSETFVFENSQISM